MDLPDRQTDANAILKSARWSPPIFLNLPPLIPSLFPSTTLTASSNMTPSVFQLAFLTILFCSRLADAQSSSLPSSSLPTSSVSTPSLPTPSVSLLSVNPTAVPLSQIVSTESPAPTPALPSTPKAGTVPTFIPNAPPLPNRKRLIDKS